MDQIVSPADEGLTPHVSTATLAHIDGLSPTPFLWPDQHPAESDQAFLPPTPRTESLSNATLSRALDVVLAGGLLVFTLPLMIFCALAVRLSGPGPIVFSQKRIGKSGEEFKCFKFRTMVRDAEQAMSVVLEASPQALFEWSVAQKLSNDPRVTPVGRFLRRYCLDELPQILNVFAGQMSIVGPRPIVAAEVVRYGPYFVDYCSVRPGLTGLWQVSGKHLLPYPERVRLDAAYAQSKCIRTDLVILCKTVPFILSGKNT